MSNSKAPSPIRTADYEAIEAALLQSARGRWFLAEYTRENRSADTRMLLDAITKLEATIMWPREGVEKFRVRRDLLEMAEAISKTRSEIAAMRSTEVEDCQFNSATEELDAIVEATEKATSDILSATENIQETAWLMREKGGCEESCSQLDEHATNIYTACSFQDLTGQRISKVVQTLQFLENRVLAMIDIWGLDDLDVRDRITDEERAESHLLNGPARRGEGIDQSQVDLVIDFDKDVGEVIEGELNAQADIDSIEAVEPAAPQSPAPQAIPAELAGPQTQVETAVAPPNSPAVPGEVEASAFSTPPELNIDELDETKNQALFN